MTAAKSTGKRDPLERLFFNVELGNNAELRSDIRKGIDIEAKNSQGLTPLILAAGQGGISTVQLLLRAGAKVDAPSSKGKTALMFAALRGFNDVAIMLIEAGADITRADNEGKDVRHYAALNDDLVALIDSIQAAKQFRVVNRKEKVEEIISDLEGDLRRG